MQNFQTENFEQHASDNLHLVNNLMKNVELNLLRASHINDFVSARHEAESLHARAKRLTAELKALEADLKRVATR